MLKNLKAIFKLIGLNLVVLIGLGFLKVFIVFILVTQGMDFEDSLRLVTSLLSVGILPTIIVFFVVFENHAFFFGKD